MFISTQIVCGWYQLEAEAPTWSSGRRESCTPALTTDNDERSDATQPAGTSSSGASSGASPGASASSSSSTAGAAARHKFRLLSSLPRALFFDRRSLTKRSSSVDTPSPASAAATDGGGGGSRPSDRDVDSATAHGPLHLVTSLGLADTCIK